VEPIELSYVGWYKGSVPGVWMWCCWCVDLVVIMDFFEESRIGNTHW